MEMSSNNITRVLFNKRYYCVDPSDSEEGRRIAQAFERIMKEWDELTVAFPIGEYIPLLRPLDLTGRSIEARLRKRRGELEKWLDHFSRSTARSARPTLHAHPEIQNPSKTSWMCCYPSKPDLIIGGTDTSTVTVTWAVVELMRHPLIRRKLQREMAEVVGGDRLVTEANLPHLKYLAAVIKETLRLHVTVPFLVRETVTATTINGYDVPPKTRVLLVLPTIHKDPSTWENPLTLDPDRFVDRHMDMQGPSFELLPFGSGRRGCPGLNLGLIMVAQLVHTCDLALPPGMSPTDVDVDEKVGVITRKLNPIRLLDSLRLPNRVYLEAGIHF